MEQVEIAEKEIYLLTKRVIDLETQVNILFPSSQNFAVSLNNITNKLREVETRLKTLEDARQVQIKLNEEFKKQPTKEVKSVWSIFKK